jgi:hypothetical protein
LLNVTDGSLRIEVWPDKAAGLLRPEDLMTAGVQTVTENNAGGVRTPPGPRRELPPRGSASFHVEARLPPMKAGRYIVRISYANMVPVQSGRQLIAGEVFSKTIGVGVL